MSSTTCLRSRVAWVQQTRRLFVGIVLLAWVTRLTFGQQVDAFAVRDPVLTDDDIEHLKQVLNLNEFQVAVIEGIAGAMRQWQHDTDVEYRRRLKALREFEAEVEARIQRARDNRDYAGLGWTDEERAVSNSFTAWYDDIIATARSRCAGVLNDIGAILDDVQRPIWEEYVRDWRRRRTLETGASFAAERVDLKVLFLEQMTIPEEQQREIAPLISEYSRAVDPVLIRRNEMLRAEHAQRRQGPSQEFQDLTEKLRQNQISIDDYSEAVKDMAARDLEAELDRMRSRYDAHRAIRDTTLNYFDACIRLLPGELVEVAQRRFEATAYPDIVRPLPIDRVVDQALSLENLGPKQRSAIESIRDTQWKPSRRQIDLQLMQLQDREEAQWRERRLGQQDPRIGLRRGELLSQRQAIQQLAINLIRELLTDQQQGLLTWPTLSSTDR